ncbi:hypothetical protein [Bartonella sp. LJL80]
MSDIFPYGNDLAAPEDWVGQYETKSRSYFVRPAGGFPLKAIASQKTFIFIGLESMAIGIFYFNAMGASAGVRAAKIIQKPEIRKVGEKTEDLTDNMNGLNENMPSNDPDKPALWGEDFPSTSETLKMWNQGRKNATLIKAKKPFSLRDLNGLSVDFIGLEGELIFAGGAEVLWIRSEDYFGWKCLYSVDDDGLIGASASAAKGTMDIQAHYNPYSAEARKNKKDKDGIPLYYKDDYYPLIDYQGALEYFRYLPGRKKTVPQSTIDKGLAYASGKSYR